MFSSSNLMVSDHRLRSIHLMRDEFYIRCKLQRSSFFSAPFAKETVLSPGIYFSSFVRDQLDVDTYICFQKFYFVTLIYLFWRQYEAVFDYNCSVVCLEICYCVALALFLLFKTALTIHGLLYFHLDFSLVFSRSEKNFFGILIEIPLNLQIALVTTEFLMLFLVMHT